MIEFHLQKNLSGAKGPFSLDVKATLERGDFLAVYGPSGAGKTTLLRLLAGLLPADAGEIVVDGEVWLRLQLPEDADLKSKLVSRELQKDFIEAKTHLRANKSNSVLTVQQRSAGMLFQDYALFPHLTVEGNLRFALQKNQPESIVTELMEVMELGELRHQQPAMLSGGQRQRVALARALVQRPKLLLLDEPLAAVDQEMRFKLQAFIQRVQHEYGLTIIMVSHNKAEVMRLANRVILLDHGKVTRSGTPETIFGVSNTLTGTVVRFAGDQAVVLVGEELVWVKKEQQMELGKPLVLGKGTFFP